MGWKDAHWAVKLLYVGCALSLLANLGLRFFTHAYDHAHFGFEAWPAFASIFGFAAFCVLVFGAKLLGSLVKRPEDYYDDHRVVDGRAERARKASAEPPRLGGRKGLGARKGRPPKSKSTKNGSSKNRPSRGERS